MKGTVNWIDKNDKYLIFPKSIFFLLNFILYTTYTYQMDYLSKAWHLNITSFGFITSIPIVSFFSAIAWSSLAQRTGKYKEIIVCVVGMYSICFTSFQGLERVMHGQEELERFVVVAIIYGSMSILSSALFPLLDHKIYVKLAKDPRFSPELFGRQRLWGTVGQGVAGFMAGVGIKRFGYPAIFILSAGASVLFILLVIVGFESSHDPHPEQSEKIESDKSDDENAGSNEKIVSNDSENNEKIPWSVAMKKLMHLRFISFLLVVLVASYSRAIVGNYLVRYLSVCLRIDSGASGFLILMRTVPEICCLFFSKNILREFGVNNMLLLAQLAGLIRVTTYAWLPADAEDAKWVPFLVESLRGVNNAFLMTSGVRLAHELAPLQAQTVAQGFFHGIFGNLTTGTAGMLGSFISLCYEGKSEAEIIRIIFKFSSFGSIFGLFLFAFFYFLSRKRKE